MTHKCKSSNVSTTFLQNFFVKFVTKIEYIRLKGKRDRQWE